MSDEPHLSQAKRREPEPPQLFERAWTLRSKGQGRVLTCGIYKTLLGVEVRVGYGNHLVRSRLAPTVDAARGIAEQVRLAVLSSQRFEPES